jgi:hypothetical protein
MKACVKLLTILRCGSVRLLRLGAALLLCVGWARAQGLSGSATITVSGTGPSYRYSIALSNSGTADIGTFWYAWTPSQDYLDSAPTLISSPPGWGSAITANGPTDGTAIQWVATSNKVKPGATLSGFEFTSTNTPAQIFFGNSAHYPEFRMGTSTLYIGNPLTDPGFEFVVTPMESVSAPPQLAITLSGTNVILTWPTNATGFTLESTTNLVPPAVWTPVTGQNAVTNPITATRKFYRLSQ